MKRINSSVFNYKSKKKNKLFNEHIDNNNNSNELILNKIQKRKELIHKEILSLINKNLENIEKKINNDNFNSDVTLNINTSRSQDKDNFQNYSGEKISLVTFSNTPTIDKEKDNLNNNENNQINNKNNLFLNNENVKNKKKEIRQVTRNKLPNKEKRKNKIICRNSFNLKKLKIHDIILNNDINEGIETKTDLETLINTSNFEEINDNNESSLKIENNNSKEENEEDIILTRKKVDGKIRNICIYDYSAKSGMKKNTIVSEYYKSKTHLSDNKKGIMSPNFSLFDSTSTSNTFKKSKNQFKFHQSIDDGFTSINIYLKYNKTELINFFSEINLPATYADKFIDNGFDDLDVILSLTKTSISITNQNLKDIGIICPGHRAKILIHLEEKAELFPFYLEKNIIYNNKINTNNNTYSNNDSLFKFLSGIGCQRYLNNFRRNGYFNIELLFTQMITREPITKLMLFEEFCIDTEINISKIIKCLNIESKKYIKRLRSKKLVNDIYDDKIYRNSCQPCFVF